MRHRVFSIASVSLVAVIVAQCPIPARAQSGGTSGLRPRWSTTSRQYSSEAIETIEDVGVPVSDDDYAGGPDNEESPSQSGDETPTVAQPMTGDPSMMMGVPGMADCEICPDGCKPPGANMPAKLGKVPMSAHFGDGFWLGTDDDEYSIHFHNLTQFDYRGYGEPEPAGISDSFMFPREWLIMNGKLTKPIDYYASFAFGNNSVNILDAFINWHVLDDKIQVKLGRYKTPFTYEFFGLPINGLVNPERSLFFNNLGLNRDLGVMVHGTILEKHLDYAVGIFNGDRNGLLDDSNNKDLAAYVNYKPFINNENSIFQYLNLGGSTNVGNEDSDVATPRTFRTIVPVTGVNTIGVPFLALASDVRDYGPKAFWSMHAAWYYSHLSLIGEWQSGFQDYARTGSTARINVGANSFYTQAGYFLTGEEVTGRGMVNPIRPFDIRKGFSGLGAWEIFSRYNDLNMDPSILSLSDGKPWTNNVQTYSVGMNWYWNTYVKFAFEWEHAIFGDPVFETPTQTQQTNNLFLFRSQVYF